jgi:hypothetical protein
MGKQFNIRSERAHGLAVDLSRMLHRPMSVVVEDALFAYKQKIDDEEAELWGPLLAETQAAFKASKVKFEIDDLYDPETGLPA